MKHFYGFNNLEKTSRQEVPKITQTVEKNLQSGDSVITITGDMEPSTRIN